PDRGEILVVLAEDAASARVAAPLVDVILREVEVGWLADARDGPELDQRDLGLLVAGDALRLAGAELRGQVIGQLAGDVDERAAAGGALVLDRGLDQMSVAVVFVEPPEIFPRLRGERGAAGAAAGVPQLDVGVDVARERAARDLCGRDAGHYVLELALQVGVGVEPDRARHAFQGLV